ncbi:hypothetical protein [Kitasatospora sp. NPDC085879]|uniref:hypothetical protein n=1 Tax=Kitasatospora sp. NPDC085879 TaxID=3154769 RepID=UPI0034397C34
MRAYKAAIAAAILGACACQGPHARPAPDTAAGPGSTDSTAARALVDTAAENGRTAGSVTAGFHALVMGQPTRGTVTVDRDGDCVGTIEAAKLGSVRILADGTRAWIKGDEHLWGARTAALTKDRYVGGPATAEPFASLGIFCLAARAAIAGDTGTADLTVQSSTEAGGVRTVSFTGADGSTLEIAATHHPHITRTTSGPNGEPQVWLFRHYGWPVDLTPPSADGTVDLTAVLRPDDGQQHRTDRHDALSPGAARPPGTRRRALISVSADQGPSLYPVAGAGFEPA